MEAHQQHSNNETAKLAAIGAAGGVIAAPYVLPALGVGTSFMTKQIVTLCQTSAGNGIGLAGLVNGALEHIPGVGQTLAAGGWANAVSSGVLGIGGTLLGNYISKHYDRDGQIPWGKVIKYTAIATSMLIALPSILSGLSMGLTYLAFAFGGASVASTVSGALGSSLGLMGGINVISAGAGLSGLLAHVVTCGAAALPIIGGLWLGHQGKAGPETPRTLPPSVLNGPLQIEGRVTHAPAMAHAH